MKRMLSILLTAVMLWGVLPSQQVHATPTVKETRYQLVTACISAWKNSAGAWQYGIEPGENKVYNGTISGLELTGDFNRSKVSNVRFYNNRTFDPAFDFGTANFAWNSNPWYSPDRGTYIENYYKYSLKGLTASVPMYSAKDGRVSFSYSGNLETMTGDRIDLKKRLAVSPTDGANQIAQMMGYSSLAEAPADFQKKLVDLYPTGGQAAKVEGYLFFAPFLIEYDVLADEPILPLMPPKAVLDCKTSTAFIGMGTTVKGTLKNQNPYPVIMKYQLTANGTSFYSGSAIVQANDFITVSKSYTIPNGTKPGAVFVFQLEGSNVGISEDTPPDQYRYKLEYGDLRGDFSEKEWETFYSGLGKYDKSDAERYVVKYESPEWSSFWRIHTKDVGSGALYLTNAEWKSDRSNVCKRSAVLQPSAPVDHGLRPPVIIE